MPEHAMPEHAMPQIGPRPFIVFALTLSLAFAAAPAYAQTQPPIEKQMTPEQFKAAGLDKLSPQELGNLNAWLNRTLEIETTKAAELAKDKIETENRGFFNFGKADPIDDRLVGEFRGFARGRSWTLENGQVWEQVDSASLAGVRLINPDVRITPSLVGNSWYLAVEGYNTRAQVRRIK